MINQLLTTYIVVYFPKIFQLDKTYIINNKMYDLLMNIKK